MNQLQEQHNDLLGLLAQQEVELLTFKVSLEDIGGLAEVQKAEAKAQREALNKYGSYIDFRNNSMSGFGEEY